ncbi:MAG: VapB-type antitoxin [Thermoprotei archaeon]
MPRRTVTIKVREEVAKLVEEMIKLGIADNRNQAYNMLIEAGLEKIRGIVEYEKRVEALVNEFLEKGIPFKKLPRVEDVYEARSR